MDGLIQPLSEPIVCCNRCLPIHSIHTNLLTVQWAKQNKNNNKYEEEKKNSPQHATKK